MSLGAVDETLDGPAVWRAISDLHEELSMGIEFLDPKQTRQRGHSRLPPLSANSPRSTPW